MNGFGSLFERLYPGKDCSVILKDPGADPMDKEICSSFQEFASSFPSIDNDETTTSKQGQRSNGDENLDDQLAKGVDPSLLVEPNRPREGTRKGYSSFTRVIVTTRPDGSVEEKRTHRDSKGNETETIIIREPVQRFPAISSAISSVWDKLSDKLSDWWPKD